LLLIGVACKKSSDGVTFTGKIIIARCGVIAVQIDGATGNGGGAVWTNGGVTYSNAAAIGNYCYVSGLGIRAGDSVSFKIQQSNPQPNATCLIEYCLNTSPPNTIYVTNMVKTGP
jgi:hypothetical protein